MNDITKAFKFLNQTLLPSHNPASFGHPLKIHTRQPSGTKLSDSNKVTSRNQKKDHENSSFETSRSNRKEDSKLGTNTAHRKAHNKIQQMNRQTTPDSTNEKLKQQSLPTPEPKV